MPTPADTATGRLRGIPEALHPVPAPETADRYTLVEDGPRNLAARPFDYRNPFPLRAGDEAAAPEPDGAAFSWFAGMTAPVGVPGGPECGLVHETGALRGHLGMWSFALGDQADTPRLRLAPADDSLAVLEGACPAGGFGYGFSYYAAPCDGPPVSYRVQPGGGHRWAGPVAPEGPNLLLVARCMAAAAPGSSGLATVHLTYTQEGEAPAGAPAPRDGGYAPAVADPALEPLGQGRYRLVASLGGRLHTLALLVAPHAEVEMSMGFLPARPEPLPGAPKREAAYRCVLRRRVGSEPADLFSWVVPFFPVPADADTVLRGAAPDMLRAEAVAVEAVRAARRPLHIEVPERKPQQVADMASRNLDVCAVELGESLAPSSGPTGGSHGPHPRERADLIHAVDLAGGHDDAARMLEQHWLEDVTGENAGPGLWALGQHWALTRDQDWLRRMLPDATRRMAFLMRTWAEHRQANDGLLPPATLHDAEAVEGHVVSQHLYALAGAREAVAMARGAGDARLIAAWEAFRAAFEAEVMRGLDRLLETTDGILTPAFEGYDAKAAVRRVPHEDLAYRPAGSYGKTGGLDALNLAAVYPTGVLPPDHPWVASSLSRWGNAYIEGAFPYPLDGRYSVVSPANSLLMAETWLRRGAYAETLRDFYGALLHTSSAHGSGTVDTASRAALGVLPDNVFGARFRRLLRNMLVHEGVDGRLHLLGCLPPAWMAPDREVVLEGAPTAMGRLSFRAAMRGAGMDLEYRFEPHGPATELVLHLPPFLNEAHVKCGNQRAATLGAAWLLPTDGYEARVWWRDEPLPALSHDAVVGAYLADARRRFAGA